MQPSPAMQALIEQIYHIFRRYPVPGDAANLLI